MKKINISERKRELSLDLAAIYGGSDVVERRTCPLVAITIYVCKDPICVYYVPEKMYHITYDWKAVTFFHNSQFLSSSFNYCDCRNLFPSHLIIFYQTVSIGMFYIFKGGPVETQRQGCCFFVPVKLLVKVLFNIVNRSSNAKHDGAIVKQGMNMDKSVIVKHGWAWTYITKHTKKSTRIKNSTRLTNKVPHSEIFLNLYSSLQLLLEHGTVCLLFFCTSSNEAGRLFLIKVLLEVIYYFYVITILQLQLQK